MITQMLVNESRCVCESVAPNGRCWLLISIVIMNAITLICKIPAIAQHLCSLDKTSSVYFCLPVQAVMNS